MSGPVPIQLGLFGGFGTVAGIHRVSAHTRVLADGTEVFVAEHLRWSRGRTSRRPAEGRRPTSPGPEQDLQQGLFEEGAPQPK